MRSFFLPDELPLMLLITLLILATSYDMRTRRIPNRLIMFGSITGLIVNLLAGSAAGKAVGPIFLSSLYGFLLGLTLLLPFYLMNTLGAGDVKLMAMVGMFLGPKAVIGATLLTMLAGGVLAIVMALHIGQLSSMLWNTYCLIRRHENAPGPDNKRTRKRAKPSLPYAAAILAGTTLQLILARHSAWQAFS